ncbi:methyltransferase domain-containing protein [Dokdonella soli]|uniref:Methyltransferase type 11 domain-containing protein n=1 Tax=Dokdonella soli TaxID=529810 RepID=A0ABP3TXS6_9GAMM
MNALHFPLPFRTPHSPVITGPDNLFALPELEALLREELATLAVRAARQPAGRALLLQACAANRGLPVDTRHLGAIRGHVERDALRGDVACTTDALPWEDEAFQLVFAQHVGDVLPSSRALIDELARVLAPGGVLLWCGLNPWSPWLAWIHWQARRGLPVPRVMHADIVRMRLLKRQLAPAGTDYLGTCWPQRSKRSAIGRSALLSPLRGAWLIAATKQRAVLTPLRPRAARERVVIQPHLATPSRRACA